MMRLATLLLLLLACGCAKLRPPASMDVDGLRLTRTEVDKWLITPMQSQLTGTLFVHGGDEVDYSTQRKVYALTLQETTFTATHVIPFRTNPPRTLVDAQTALSLHRKDLQEPFAESLITYNLRNKTRKETQFPEETVHRYAQVFRYEAGVLTVNSIDRKSRSVELVYLPDEGKILRHKVDGYLAKLSGFVDGELRITFALADGTTFWFEPSTLAVESGKLDPGVVDWLNTAQSSSKRGTFDGAFAGELIGVRTAKGIEFWNGEKVITLETRDAFMTKPNGGRRSELMANFLVDHPEELAAEGEGLPLDVHSTGALVRPFDERRLVILDKHYNRIVLVEQIADSPID